MDARKAVAAYGAAWHEQDEAKRGALSFRALDD